jgi:hypothetical protein
MDIGKAGMKEGHEMPGLQGKELNLGELSELAGKIRSRLRYDALDTGMNRAATSERKGVVKEIKHELLQLSDHMVTFAAMHEGNVVGFLAVEKTPSGKKASVKALWTSVPSTAQRPIVGKLLNTAKHYLTDHGYPKLKIEPISASPDFAVVTANPTIGRFLRIERNANAEERMDIQIAEEETMSHVASPSIVGGETFSAPEDEAQESHMPENV